MLALDIQLEIIKRLPVKSLIQFRSVCKAWKSFIDSSQFIAGYSVPHTQPQHLLIKYEVEDPQITEVKYVCFVDDDTFPQQKFAPTLPSLLEEVYPERIIDSSHGVLCFYCFYHPKKGDLWPNSSLINMALLWNPSIRKSMAVVVPYVFDAPFSSVLGFGVCPDTCDPMLVNITYISKWLDPKSISCIPCQVKVFTLSSGEWTCLCSDRLPRKSIGFTWSSAVIGQFIYWFAFDRIDGLDVEPRNLIMSFDMSSQEFREIDLPDCLAVEVYESNMSVSRLRESLVLLDYRKPTNNKQVCDVWMMEHGDSKAFTKLFTINPPNVSVSETVGFRKSGEPIVELLDELPDDEDIDTLCDIPCLVVYEPCSEHVKDLDFWGNSFSAYSYTESLLLLDHDDGHIVRCGDVKR